jgi:hypothetical protein
LINKLLQFFSKDWIIFSFCIDLKLLQPKIIMCICKKLRITLESIHC